MAKCHLQPDKTALYLAAISRMQLLIQIGCLKGMRWQLIRHSDITSAIRSNLRVKEPFGLFGPKLSARRSLFLYFSSAP